MCNVETIARRTVVRGSRPEDHSALCEFVVVDGLPRTDEHGFTYVMAAPIRVVEPGVGRDGDYHPTIGVIDRLRHGDMI